MNVMMGIRSRCIGSVAPGIALPRGTPKGKFVPIGTIPAGSFVQLVDRVCEDAYGAGFTLDIGGGTRTPPTPPVFDLRLRRGPRSLARSPRLPQTLTFGYVPDEMSRSMPA